MLSALLDVGIGLILVFLVLSIAVSAASELINNVAQRRAKDLEKFVASLLTNSKITTQNFYQNTALSAQVQNNRKPSYIQAGDFVDALFTTLHSQNQSLIGGQLPDFNVDSLKQMVATMPDSAPLKKVLASALAKPTNPAVQAVDEMTRVRAALELWYDNSMDRVSGWFKRHTQYLILAIGLIIALAFNVDTIAIANNLLRNPAVRGAIAARAGATGQSLLGTGTAPGTGTPGAAAPESDQNFLAGLQIQLGQLDMPIGWPDPGLATADLNWWLKKIIGILITGFAVSQGAPFWFDLLNRITNLRGAGVAPAKSIALPPPAPESAPSVVINTQSAPVAAPPAASPPVSPPPAKPVDGTSPGNAADSNVAG